MALSHHGKQEGLIQLFPGKLGVRVGTGKVGEGAHQFETGMSMDKVDQFEEFGGFGAEAIHAGVELRLDQGGGSGLFRRLTQLAGLLDGGKGDSEEMGKSDGEFRWKG